MEQIILTSVIVFILWLFYSGSKPKMPNNHYEKTSKRLDDIKNEIALKYGYRDWHELREDANLYHQESYFDRLKEAETIYNNQFNG